MELLDQPGDAVLDRGRIDDDDAVGAPVVLETAKRPTGRGGAFTLGLGLVNGMAFVSEAETWSLERLHRTLKLANTPVVCAPTGSAMVRDGGAWRHVGQTELHGDL